MSGVKVVWGGGSFGFSIKEHADVVRGLDLIKAAGIDTIDTAQAYHDNEEVLGNLHAGDRFTIDTKFKSGMDPGSNLNAVETGKASLARLQVKQVDIFYLHMPDRTVPIEDQLKAVNDFYKTGGFKRFGLSNYNAKDVQEIYDICKAKGYVLPTAFQGNYNPITRRNEKELFPTLRKLGIAFYAYSPSAGGFLVKTKEQVLAGEGRFGEGMIGDIYKGLYAKETLLDSLTTWHGIAKDAGCSANELALRWVRYHSILKPELGDALILGASKISQLEDTVQSVHKGALPADIVKRIEDIWAKVEAEAPQITFEAPSS